MTAWPLDARPVVKVAGLFPLRAKGFDYVYCATVHALHFHEYRGSIRIDGRVFPIEPGTLTLSPAELESAYDIPRPGVHWCIHFIPQPVRAARPRITLPWVRPLGALQGEAVPRFAQVARLHHAAEHEKDAAMAAAASIALQELLVWYALLDRVGRTAAAPRGDG
ncbi:MAG: putative AraC family transcriptional regulator, partial [Phycisphaerales bacterium]|nr:putative AraC family transcriptional regulator [Phycisphaerales bacterium]